jgi:hypothetical protein
MFAQHRVDGGGREAQSLEPSRCRRIARRRFVQDPIEGARATRTLVFFERIDRGGRFVAIDTLTDQFTDEAHVAQRFALALDVELRKEPVVEKPFGLATIDDTGDGVVVVPFARKALPQLRLRQPPARQHPERTCICTRQQLLFRDRCNDADTVTVL